MLPRIPNKAGTKTTPPAMPKTPIMNAAIAKARATNATCHLAMRRQQKTVQDGGAGGGTGQEGQEKDEADEEREMEKGRRRRQMLGG